MCGPIPVTDPLARAFEPGDRVFHTFEPGRVGKVKIAKPSSELVYVDWPAHAGRPGHTSVHAKANLRHAPAEIVPLPETLQPRKPHPLALSHIPPRPVKRATEEVRIDQPDELREGDVVVDVPARRTLSGAYAHTVGNVVVRREVSDGLPTAPGSVILGHDKGRSVPLQLRRGYEGYGKPDWMNQFSDAWPVGLVRSGGFTVLHDAGVTDAR